MKTKTLSDTTVLLLKNEANMLALRDLVLTFFEPRPQRPKTAEDARTFLNKAYNFQIDEMMKLHKDSPAVVDCLKTLKT